jgi:hypothetical protein
MPGASDADRAGAFLVLFSGMAGTIAMTRVISDPQTREQALGMARDYYLSTFAPNAAGSIPVS